MGMKTVRFEEFDQRVAQYWQPSDYDAATVSGEVAGVAQGWQGQGFIQLMFDDETQMLTQVNHRMPNGAYQEIWATGENPAAALAAAHRAMREQNMPATFNDMWQTYNGWDEYLEYAQQRYISENTNFLLAVEEYRQSPSLQAQLEIYGRFIAPDAPEQINIDDTMVKEIEDRADGGADVFDRAQQTIMQMLAGDFATFQAWYKNLPYS